MRKLSDQEIEKIMSLFKDGKPLPEVYKTALFDTKKEYELIYADKEREVDILADTMAVPLQTIKPFRNGKHENGWTNMLIFGDNLQALKTLLQMKLNGARIWYHPMLSSHSPNPPLTLFNYTTI